MRDDSAEIFFQSFLQEALVSKSGLGRGVNLWCCPSSISFADYGNTDPQRGLEGWCWRLSWHMTAWTVQVSVFWHLSEEVPVDPQGSWSYFTPSCWSCAPSRSGAIPTALSFKSLILFFFHSQQAQSMFHSHTEGWQWQTICTVWTCLWSWWCCTARSCLVWQSWHGLLLSRCHLCTGLLPGTWKWSPPLTALMLIMLLVMILLYSMLTSIPNAVALSTSLLMRSWSSPLLPPIRLMSSANHRLHMGPPPMGMDVWWSWSVSRIFSRIKLNRMGESMHPWH